MPTSRRPQFFLQERESDMFILADTRLHFYSGAQKVFHRDLTLLRRHRLSIRRTPLNSRETRLSDQTLQISSRKAHALLSNLVHLGRPLEASEALRQRAQNVDPVVCAGQADVEECLEPAGSEHRGVDDVGSVCGGDDVDALSGRAYAVEFGEQGVDDAAAGLGVRAVAPRDERVELVEEDYDGHGTPRAAEERADRSLGFADVFVQEFGALDADEVCVRGVGDGFGEQGFAVARWAPEEDARCGVYAH